MLKLLQSISRSAWLSFAALSAILTFFFLPLSWKQRADASAAWGPLLQSIDARGLLVAYAVFLTMWLFVIDVRPTIEQWRREREAKAPDAPEATQLEEEVANFASRQLSPAFEQLAEAGRISAYVIKDTWDHPANFLIWQAFASLNSFDGRYFALASNLPAMMALNKRNAQILTLELLKQYKDKMHRLIDSIKILTEHGKPFSPHNFDGLLRTWLESHYSMLTALKRLQAIPGLETFQEFDVATHLEHSNYNAGIVESALS